MNKHVNVRVMGKVQGVFFRTSVKEKAQELGIVGFVRNEDDGSVYIEAVGGEKELDQLVAWCREGPRLARVEEVVVEPAAMGHFKDFCVR